MASDVVSPAERIRELSAINAEIAALVKDAGSAVTALTDRPLIPTSDEESAEQSNVATLQDRKDTFTAHTKAYYTGLQSIIARLRRQAYALEEAGIIAPEATSAPTRAPVAGAGKPAAQTQEPEHITNGGLGNLDVGWLNSRGNQVEADKESELMEDAKALLEDLLKK